MTVRANGASKSPKSAFLEPHLAGSGRKLQLYRARADFPVGQWLLSSGELYIGRRKGALEMQLGDTVQLARHIQSRRSGNRFLVRSGTFAAEAQKHNAHWTGAILDQAI